MSSVLTRGGESAGTLREIEDAGSDARRSLWLLLGVPVALVALIGWQFVVQTSAEYNADERVGGWTVVLRELPATVLLLLPVAVGILLAVRSARRGSRLGTVAVWAHCAALLLVTWVVVDGSADGITSGDAGGVKVMLLPAEAAVAVVVLLVALRAAHRAPLHGPVALGRVTVAVLVGLAGGFGWLFAAEQVLTSHVGDFPRAGVPGVVSVNVDRVGTWFVYGEAGPDEVAISDLAIAVTGPTGASVPAKRTTAQAVYLHNGRGGHTYATFVAPVTGTYRVALTGTAPARPEFAPADPWGSFAVGRDLRDWMWPHEIGAAVVVVGVVVGAGIAALRSRRPISETIGG